MNTHVPDAAQGTAATGSSYARAVRSFDTCDIAEGLSLTANLFAEGGATPAFRTGWLWPWGLENWSSVCDDDGVKAKCFFFQHYIIRQGLAPIRCTKCI
jgi:hypothetical protein